MVHLGENLKINIHQLMNLVPLIQEKWSFIGTRLKVSSHTLDEIYHTASEQQIPAESKNTFCCVKMLISWYETSDDVSVDAIMMAIDAPHVGLKTKILSIEAALSSNFVAMDRSEVTHPPEKLKQPYFNMITEFCLELNKSQHPISDILTYLKVCNVNSDVLEGVSDFPELIKSFERHELLNIADLSWLKNIASHIQCTKASEVVKDYENLLMVDKISWYTNHTIGTYLVGKTEKKAENVTIKDCSIAKSVVSKIVGKNETDSVLDSSEVGSVTFYWRLLSNNVGIHIPKSVGFSLIKECKTASLTDIGIIIDGSVSDWAYIDHETGIKANPIILN